MTPAQELRAAADYLAVHGWMQRSYGIRRGPCCALGALGMVRVGDPMDWGVHARDALMVRVGPDISGWNDAPGRTAAEVIATLRSVADELDAQAVTA